MGCVWDVVSFVGGGSPGNGWQQMPLRVDAWPVNG